MSAKSSCIETHSLTLSPLDVKFADFMTGLAGDPGDRHVWLAAALVSWQTASGHICLPLEEFSGRGFSEDGGGKEALIAPDLPTWLQKLQSCEVVGGPGEHAPMILEGHRLYLNRYWSYERELIGFIERFTSSSTPVADAEELRGKVAGLFPDENSRAAPDWQKIAALMALLKRFCIISGSPGTGKTSIVFKILLLLLEENRSDDLRIAIAAPTGKAANRLKESLRNWKTRLKGSHDRVNSVPDEVFTLHRLLGSRPYSSEFTFNGENPLPYDVVVVDEGSMIDLPLLVKLMRALPGDGRLIILGDQNQLASVEAGAVLNDLCQGASENRFSPDFRKTLMNISGEDLPLSGSGGSLLADSIVVLKKNFRFPQAGGIARFSQLVNDGAARQAFALIEEGSHPDCVLLPGHGQEGLARRLVDLYAYHFEGLYGTGTPREFLDCFADFKVLCAVRQGPFGVEALNAGIEHELGQRGLIARRGQGPASRPIMITANDYRLGLFNGDIGVLFYDPEKGRCEAFFPLPDGELRKISPARLPAYESAFAMTVHKSQGSEFKRILLLLPSRGSDLLTRELIYTAITRAREKIEILTRKEVFLEAVSRRISRNSGIAAALMRS